MSPPFAPDPTFLAFAQVHLSASRRGEVAVASAFSTYAKFCRRTGRRALSRANFGAALLVLARPLGGCRAGETITALELKKGEAAPACEAIRAVPAPPAMPSAQRLREPLPRLLSAPGGLPAFSGVDDDNKGDSRRARGMAGHGDDQARRAECAEEHFDRDRGAEYDARLLHSFGAAGGGDRRTTAHLKPPGCDGRGRRDPALIPSPPIIPVDPVADFLATRLIEAPGFVVALESLRAAVRAADLKFSDVIDRAKARGHAIRKNAWGPDFLTDAQLVEVPLEAAE